MQDEINLNRVVNNSHLQENDYSERISYTDQMLANLDGQRRIAETMASSGALTKTGALKTAADIQYAMILASDLKVPYSFICNAMEDLSEVLPGGGLNLKRSYLQGVCELRNINVTCISNFQSMYIWLDPEGHEWDMKLDIVPPPYFNRDKDGNPILHKRKKVRVVDRYGNLIPLDDFGEEYTLLGQFDAAWINNRAGKDSALQELLERELGGKSRYVSKEGEPLRKFDASSKKVILNPPAGGYKMEDFSYKIKERTGDSAVLNWIESDDKQTVLQYIDDKGIINYQRYTLSEAIEYGHRETLIDTKDTYANGKVNPNFGKYKRSGSWFNEPHLMLFYKTFGDLHSRLLRGKLFISSTGQDIIMKQAKDQGVDHLLTADNYTITTVDD